MVLFMFGILNSETLIATEIENAIQKERCEDIFDAVLKGNLSEVKRFVEEENVDVNSVNSISDEFPLYIASREGYLEIVEFLCEHGAKPEIEDSYLLPPFWVANSYNHIEIAAYLYHRFYSGD